MDKTELDKKLSNGEKWRFIKEINDNECLGWILICKLEKFLFTPKKEDYSIEELYLLKIKEAEKREKTPYQVHIIELRRDAHESEEYVTGDDIRQKDNYYLSCIDEVEKFIEELGYSFDNIKHRSEIDAP